MGNCTRYQHLPAHAHPRNAGVVPPKPDGHVGYLIDHARPLTLVCWRCKRRSVLTPEQVRAAATRGVDEEIARLALRCRCSGCGARGPEYAYEGEPRPMLHGRTYTRQGTLRSGEG